LFKGHYPIELSMSIEVTILGCGSATPTLTRNPTSQWIDIHGTSLLIDCGEGTQAQMLKLNLKMNRLKAICISHLHGDHFFGLPGLLSSMHLLGRKNKLIIFGPPPLKKFLEDLFQLSDTTLRFPLEFIPVIESSNSEKLADFGSFQLLSIPLNHRISCSGFLIKEKPKPRNLRPEYLSFHEIPINKRQEIKEGVDFIKNDGTVIKNSQLTFDPPRSVSYAFCSDTAPLDDTVKAIANSTVLYHEATFEDELIERAELTFHSTASQAASQAKNANVEQLYIGHFSSRYSETKRLEDQAKSIFNKTFAVYDGFKFKIE
jgi:ribonuclease Z